MEETGRARESFAETPSYTSALQWQHSCAGGFSHHEGSEFLFRVCLRQLLQKLEEKELTCVSRGEEYDGPVGVGLVSLRRVGLGRSVPGAPIYRAGGMCF